MQRAPRAYTDIKYKENFEFADQLRNIRDKSDIKRLNEDHERKLRARDLTGIHPPPRAPQDRENIERFTYSPDREQQPFTDLDINEYMGITVQPLTVDDLKRHKIGVIYKWCDHSAKKWSVYKSLICEAALNGRTFVLSSGNWFEIAKQYADRIQNKVKELMSPLSLPASKLGEHESDYNKRVAKQSMQSKAFGDALRLDAALIQNNRLARDEGQPGVVRKPRFGRERWLNRSDEAFIRTAPHITERAREDAVPCARSPFGIDHGVNLCELRPRWLTLALKSAPQGI